MNNLQFYIKINTSGDGNIVFWCEPKEEFEVLKYYDISYNLEEFNEILADLEEQRKLPSPTKNLGRNDSNLIVYGEKCRLDCEFISGLPPLEISTEDVIYFFTKFRDFYIQYQQCQIPGVIPESKLDTYMIAPREYVNSEFLAKEQAHFDELLLYLTYTGDKEHAYYCFRRHPAVFEQFKSLSKEFAEKQDLIRLSLILSNLPTNRNYQPAIRSLYFDTVLNEKIEEYAFPKSIKNFIHNLIGYKDFSIKELDNLLWNWRDLLNNEGFLRTIIQYLNLEDYKDLFKKMIARYPNVLIELKEIKEKNADYLTRGLLTKIIKENIINDSHSFHIKGIFNRLLIEEKMGKYKISCEKREDIWIRSITEKWEKVEEFDKEISKYKTDLQN